MGSVPKESEAQQNAKKEGSFRSALTCETSVASVSSTSEQAGSMHSKRDICILVELSMDT